MRAPEPGKKVIGYGWCGCYSGTSDHRLGWLMPPFVSHKQSASLTTEQRKALGLLPNKDYATGDMWRVKVTIEPVKDKRGKYIVRRARRARTSTATASKG